MKYIPHLLRVFALLGLVATTGMLTGCATSQERLTKFESNLPKSGFAYGQVNQLATYEDLAKVCASGKGAPDLLTSLCSRKSEVNTFVVGMLIDGVPYQYGEAYPKSITLQPGAIVKLDMSKPRGSRFVEVVTQEETDTCKWSGHYNNALDRGAFTNGARVAGAFTFGLILPLSVPTLIAERNITGGVECDGWDYKQAFKDVIAANK